MRRETRRELRPAPLVKCHSPNDSCAFDQATDDQLREWLKPIGAEVGRRQLLALARNRWGDGYIEIEEFTNYGDNLGGPVIEITETPFHINSG